MKKSNLFLGAAVMILVSSFVCRGWLECEPKKANAKSIAQRVQKNAIIKLKNIERKIFGGNQDGIRQN